MARIQALVQELPHTVSMATKNKTKQKPTHTHNKNPRTNKKLVSSPHLSKFYSDFSNGSDSRGEGSVIFTDSLKPHIIILETLF